MNASEDAERQPKRRSTNGAKQPFDVALALSRIARAVDSYPKAALFELADQGFSSAFEQLVACVLSIRTRDEVLLPTAQALFALARTPEAMSRLSFEAIDRCIGTVAFHAGKAAQIRDIARRVAKEFGGTLPCREEVLRSFRGVGPKCAHLVLGISCGKPAIGVDVHVFRITNRWGYVHATTPEKTMQALEKKLPKRFWLEINRLLVPFGKHICTGRLPKCSTCPVLDMCLQIGVDAHR